MNVKSRLESAHGGHPEFEEYNQKTEAEPTKHFLLMPLTLYRLLCASLILVLIAGKIIEERPLTVTMLDVVLGVLGLM